MNTVHTVYTLPHGVDPFQMAPSPQEQMSRLREKQEQEIREANGREEEHQKLPLHIQLSHRYAALEHPSQLQQQWQQDSDQDDQQVCSWLSLFVFHTIHTHLHFLPFFFFSFNRLVQHPCLPCNRPVLPWDPQQ